MKVCHIPSLKLTSLLTWLFVYRGPPGYLLASSVPLLNLTVPQSLPCPPFTKTWQGNHFYFIFFSVSWLRADQQHSQLPKCYYHIIPQSKTLFFCTDVWSLSVSCCQVPCKWPNSHMSAPAHTFISQETCQILVVVWNYNVLALCPVCCQRVPAGLGYPGCRGASE